jgi:hypothetical protein
VALTAKQTDVTLLVLLKVELHPPSKSHSMMFRADALDDVEIKTGTQPTPRATVTEKGPETTAQVSRRRPGGCAT